MSTRVTGSAVDADAPVRGRRRRWVLAGLAVYSVGLCVAQLVALRAAPDTSEGLGYVCMAGFNAALGLGSVMLSRRAAEKVQLRWRLVALACGFGTLGYLVAATGRLHFVSFAVSSPNMTWLFDLREVLLLFAILLVSRARRQLMVLDGAQAVLFVGLRFSLTYFPGGVSLLAQNHLLITMIVAGYFCVMAWAASWGAASEEEHWSLQMLTLILLARFVQLICVDAIAYIWLGQVHGSAWDAVGSAVNLALAWYLVRQAYAMPETPAMTLRARPSLLVRSLMPSFLAVGNVLLSLLALERSRWFAVAGVGAATCWYAVRVAIVQRGALEESSRLKKNILKLEHIAGRDELTKAGNRHSLLLAFDVFVAVNQQTAALDAASFSLVLTDLDCFKQANDSHGHLYGDEALRRTAQVLQRLSAAYPESHCSRLGGDEFAVLLPHVRRGEALRFAEHVRAALDALAMPAGDATLSLSVGVTEMQVRRGLELSAAIAQADTALYRAKALGRNRVEFFAGDGESDGGAESLRGVTAMREPCLPAGQVPDPRDDRL